MHLQLRCSCTHLHLGAGGNHPVGAAHFTSVGNIIRSNIANISVGSINDGSNACNIIDSNNIARIIVNNSDVVNIMAGNISNSHPVTSNSSYVTSIIVIVTSNHVTVTCNPVTSTSNHVTICCNSVNSNRNTITTKSSKTTTMCATGGSYTTTICSSFLAICVKNNSDKPSIYSVFVLENSGHTC